jgi:hypothetical protein
MDNFSCAARTGGATLDGTTFTGLTSFPSSTAIAPTGAIGIGMAPSKILDITQNQNGASSVQILNNNSSGSSATSNFRAVNSVGSIEIGVTGSAYGGLNNLIFNMGYISVPAFANGFIMGSAGPILFADGNFVERARFGSDGSFLVGTTSNGGWSGGAKAEVRSSVNAFSVYASGAVGNAISSRVDNTSAWLAGFYYGGSTIGSITTNGTTTAFNTTSDGRLKNTSVPQRNYRATIRSLWVGDFVWKKDGSPGFGIIAQQTYPLFPTAVRKPLKDGIWQADYSKLAPLALWGVKDIYKVVDAQNMALHEQSDDIRHMRELIASQRDELAQLEDRFASVEWRLNSKLASYEKERSAVPY